VNLLISRSYFMSEVGLQKNELDTPALWVDLNTLESNIATLAALFERAGVQWRPHIKGIKIPAIAHKLLKAGAIGVTCAKLGEAEVMAAAGIEDILVANQVVGPQKITRLVNLRGQVDVKVAVDDLDNVAALGAAAQAKGVELGIVVEVNTGMNRAGVTPGRPAVEFSRKIHETPGLRYMGLMAWEGHTLVHEDVNQKRREVEKAVGLLAETAAMCREADLPVSIVSGGGSGTYKITPFLPGLTEIQAGGAIFCDLTYQHWGVETEPALFVRSTVVSRPTPDRLIFDAGFKALPAWLGRTPRPVGLPHFDGFKASAEHGVVIVTAGGATVKVGDAFDFIPGYTDMTLFLHDELYGVRDGLVEVVWPIQARGKIR
jgi:D-serine deaminase-like pyridoxal phosphate-dependent protein